MRETAAPCRVRGGIVERKPAITDERTTHIDARRSGRAAAGAVASDALARGFDTGGESGDDGTRPGHHRHVIETSPASPTERAAR